MLARAPPGRPQAPSTRFLGSSRHPATTERLQPNVAPDQSHSRRLPELRQRQRAPLLLAILAVIGDRFDQPLRSVAFPAMPEVLDTQRVEGLPPAPAKLSPVLMMHVTSQRVAVQAVTRELGAV